MQTKIRSEIIVEQFIAYMIYKYLYFVTELPKYLYFVTELPHTN